MKDRGSDLEIDNSSEYFLVSKGHTDWLDLRQLYLTLERPVPTSSLKEANSKNSSCMLGFVEDELTCSKGLPSARICFSSIHYNSSLQLTIKIINDLSASIIFFFFDLQL